MRIGLIDVDGKSGFPNFALMRLSAYMKSTGHLVEWADQFEWYDRIYASKVFTFTPDINRLEYRCDEFEGGDRI